MAYPEINTILRQTVNEVTTIHNSAPTIQTIISKDSPTITTIVNGFWDAVWSVNGQTGDVRIEFTFDPFKPNTVYLQNQAIVHNDNIYIAKNSFTSGATFNEADWNIIGDMANADMVTYNNTETGISATTVQDALDYAIGQVPTDFFKLSTTTISGEGSIINLSDTAETPFKNVVLKGDTFQQTYTGKNLYNVSTLSTSDSTTYDEDGWITISYDNSAGSSDHYSNVWTTNLNLLASTQYAIFLEVKSVSGDYGQSELAITSTNSTSGQFGSWQTKKLSALTAGNIYKVAPTTKADLTSVTDGLRTVLITKGGATATVTFRLSVWADTSATTDTFSYEPYVGGIPAPNPDYPQDIKVVTGEQTVKVTGKNLLPIITQNGSGMTNTYDPITGEVTTTGQPTTEWVAPTPYMDVLFPEGTVLAAKRYQTIISGDAPTSFALRLRDSTNNTDDDMNPSTSGSTKTMHKDITRAQIWLHYDTSKTYNFKWKIQLEKGSTATAFVPYQEQSYEVNLGKNLFDKNGTKIYGGYFGGTPVAIRGMSYPPTSPDRWFYIPCQPNTTYTVTKPAQPTTSLNRFRLGTTTTVPEHEMVLMDYWNAGDGSTTTTHTITTGADARYLCVYFAKATNIEDTDGQVQAVLDGLQIEKGSTATSYVPYVPPLELCKIGTYQDYIWNDNGTWKKHKAILKTVLNGSEAWATRNASGVTSNFRFSTNPFDYPATGENSVNAYLDRFIGRTDGATADVECFWFNQTGLFRIAVLKSRLSEDTLSGFQAWLAENNVTMYSPLATPTDETITDATLIAQLEDLRSAYSYKEQTNISVRAIDPNLPFILSVDAFLNTTWEGFQSGVGKLAENVQQDTLKKWDIQDNISDGDDKLVTGGGVYDALREIDNNSVAAHNSIVRGKDLTNIYTMEQLSAKLVAGDFSDIYVGDYITKAVKVGNNTERELDFVIAHIDYFMHVGDTETTRHHLVMVPDTAFYEYMQMNDTNTTTGGYYGSKGHGICNAVYSAGTGGTLTSVVADYTTFQATTLGAAEGTFVFTHTSSGWQYDGTVVSTGNLSTYGITYTGTPVDGDVITVSYVPGYLEPYRQAIYTAFGNDHILAHRTQYSTSTSTNAWHTNRCELMNESMVYGQIVRANNVFGELTENSQLAWFSARPDKRVAMRGKGSTSRSNAWLSSINSGSNFCNVYGNGFANYNGASSSCAVRPYFLFA